VQKELKYYKMASMASMASICSKCKIRQQDNNNDGGGKAWVHELRSLTVQLKRWILIGLREKIYLFQNN
jgi:hypothetical protein